MTVLDDIRPIREFRASFWVYMRGDQCGDTGVKGHCGAEGISFVFGPLPDNYEFGELGVGTGLRVSLLTGLEQRIEVRYNETLVASVPTPLFKIEASEGAPRNTGGWSQVVVTKSSDGLHIVHDGEQRIHNLTLAQWSPQTYWKFGFGARTSAAVDQHMLSITYWNCISCAI